VQQGDYSWTYDGLVLGYGGIGDFGMQMAQFTVPVYKFSGPDTSGSCAPYNPSYTCSADNMSYHTYNECDSNCSNESFECAAKPGVSYSSSEECKTACSTPISCNSSSDNYKFKVDIQKKGDNDYWQNLYIEEPLANRLAQVDFEHEDDILRQCVDRYLQPYLEFEDPGTGAKFKYSYFDELAYQYAASLGQSPRDTETFSLPKYPPTFRPGPGDEGISSPPNWPMFLNPTANSSWINDNSKVLGDYTLSMSNLIPSVYYYECPVGNTHQSSTNTCGYISPFGGNDKTVKGTFCFQNRCDSEAVIEPDNNYSGCGMVNDGEWQ